MSITAPAVGSGWHHRQPGCFRRLTRDSRNRRLTRDFHTRPKIGFFIVKLEIFIVKMIRRTFPKFSYIQLPKTPEKIKFQKKVARKININLFPAVSEAN